MLGEKIIKLAQSDQVMEEFVNTEVKLQDLNNEFYELTKEYKMGSNTADYYSFFNFSNLYFWFVLVGLLLLAFGLLFLLAELKQRSKNTKTVVHFEKSKTEEISEPEPEVELEVKAQPKKVKKIKKIEETAEKPKTKAKKKPFKVKVVKVK